LNAETYALTKYPSIQAGAVMIPSISVQSIFMSIYFFEVIELLGWILGKELFGLHELAIVLGGEECLV
jgi:hypothetical protein